jgi:GNAT superfamily N-acetyltransferase
MRKQVAQFSKYRVSSDPSLLDFDYVFAFLKHESYWGRDLTEEKLKRSFARSDNFGLYDIEQGSRQIGFARAITDRTLFAYLRDVFIEDGYRGLGLGAFLCRSVMESESLKEVGHWLLATKDAHTFYEKLGFHALKAPDYYMERKRGRKKSDW